MKKGQVKKMLGVSQCQEETGKGGCAAAFALDMREGSLEYDKARQSSVAGKSAQRRLAMALNPGDGSKPQRLTRTVQQDSVRW